MDAIRGDIAKKETMEIEGRHLTIAECRNDYIRNECEPSIRINALDEYCRSLEKCMNRDPPVEVLRTVLIAELLGDSINSFISKLDLKACLVVITLILL